MTKIADIYARTSTTKQDGGLERQIERGIRWCKRNKFEVRNIIAEQASAFKKNRQKKLYSLMLSYRLHFFKSIGEPLLDYEIQSFCDRYEISPEADPIEPPSVVVMESIDRLSRRGVNGAFSLMGDLCVSSSNKTKVIFRYEKMALDWNTIFLLFLKYQGFSVCLEESGLRISKGGQGSTLKRLLESTP